MEMWHSHGSLVSLVTCSNWISESPSVFSTSFWWAGLGLVRFLEHAMCSDEHNLTAIVTKHRGYTDHSEYIKCSRMLYDCDSVTRQWYWLRLEMPWQVTSAPPFLRVVACLIQLPPWTDSTCFIWRMKEQPEAYSQLQSPLKLPLEFTGLWA